MKMKMINRIYRYVWVSRAFMLAILLFCNISLTHAYSIRDKAPEHILKELEFKEAALINVIRVISEMSDSNIVVTPEAKEVTVTIFLRDISVKHAIETICRINNLWYRQDELTNTYRIMTNAEYVQDLVIHRDEVTKVFTVNNLNVNLAADAINNLYGERVKRSNSGQQFDASNGQQGNANGGEQSNSNNNSSNNRNSSSGSNTGASQTQNTLDQSLSIDQLSALATRGLGRNLISGSQVQQVLDREEPIYVTVASEHNLVLVRTGDMEALTQIEALIKELDRPVPQVLLEMKILDVLVDDNFSSVFNFEVNGVGLQGDSTIPINIGNNALSNSGSFIFEYMNTYLKANIELLQKNKRVNVLSTPMILASNNRPSKLFVGEEQIIVKGYSTQTQERIVNGAAAVSSSVIIPTTEVEEIGNTLLITPFINMSDGNITLNIEQENSSLRKGGGQIDLISASGEVKKVSIDTLNTARIEGTIIVKDNHTIAVGGLIRETESDDESKVPWLSDIPLLGNLFTSKADGAQRSELILLITPRVLRQPEDGEFNKQDLLRNGKQLSLEEMFLQCTQLCR
jgi:type II secretory pathway component GspD/PulD (secretin)